MPMTVVDYSAIEARACAWLAGEQWMLDAFEREEDIYVATAAQMEASVGKPFTRKQGKAAALGLQYGGGKQALWNVGFSGDDLEALEIRDAWRYASTAIKGMWKAGTLAFMDGGVIGDKLSVLIPGRDVRQLLLPSGRSIYYRGVRVQRVPRVWPDGEVSMVREGSYRDRNGKTVRMWGGLLTENFTQAVSRDIMAEAILRLEERGYPVELHVHDEVGVTRGTPEEVGAIMCELPDWAEGLPIASAGFTCSRYRKE